ncbi:MAG: hypothetical protein K2N74_01655, partial [Clostridiales bacterium]|nr:hypothetical protein [Clostridiales bacterium]
VTVTKLGHDPVGVVTETTCTAGGYTTYTCSHAGCNYTYVDDEVEATGHSYEEDEYSEDETGHWQVCTVCSKSGTRSAHTYEEVEVTKQPTETETGTRLMECVCGRQITEEIGKLDHVNHVKGDELKSDGTYHWYECTFAGCTEKLEKTEHVFGNWEETVAAECLSRGEEKHTCVCGYYETQSTDALGHSFVNYVSDGNAECLTDGTKTAHCEHGCGETDTVDDEDSALGHNYE